MRLIKGQAFYKKPWYNSYRCIADVRAAINQAPEVDAVPVVRCRDCRYKYGSDCDNFAGVLVRDDDFCNYGERREVSE